MRLSLMSILALVPLAGCAGQSDPCSGVTNLAPGADGVVTVNVHIGWSTDQQSQYMTPNLICVAKDSKVRFIVNNDDNSATDYPGPGKNNFHDVALLDYGGKDYEHEAYAGKGPVTTCADGDAAASNSQPKPCSQNYFVASVTGTFRLICEVRTNPTHDALGMHATFIVR